MPPNDRLVGMPAIARFLGRTVEQAYRLQERGDLPTAREGRKISATKADLSAWLEAEQAKTASPPAYDDGLA